MRHGRKSRSVLFDGYKRHVLTDLDTGLVPAVGITPGQRPRSQRHRRHHRRPGRRRADPGRAAHRPGLPVLGPGPGPRPGPGGLLQGLAGPQQLAAGSPRTSSASTSPPWQLTCPAGVAMPFQAGKTVRFPAATCADLPPAPALHHQQPRAQRRPSTPTRALLAELRHRQQDPGRTRGAPRARRTSSTPSPTSAAGKAAAPATAAPARTCSTCGASPSSTTSTSSPASPPPTVTKLAA